MIHARGSVQGDILLLTRILFEFSRFERAEISVAILLQLFLRDANGQFCLIDIVVALFAGQVGLGWEPTSAINRVLNPDIVTLVLNRAFFVCFTQVDHPIFFTEIRHGHVPLHESLRLLSRAEVY